MLYIASALTPTPISHTVQVTGLTGPGKSLVIAKPDHIEVWDVTASGLVSRGELDVWGTVVGLATTDVHDASPHILVLVGPPNARLLLVTWENGLVVTASQPLSPPTPLLRRQEFFTGVIVHSTTVLVSLWTGLLACIEMELEKVKEAKRRASLRKKEDMDIDGEGRRLVFKTSGNIHIREHNLLDLTFAPVREGENPVLLFLWMSETNKIQLQPRQLLVAQQRCDDQATVTDIVNPLDYPVQQDVEVDFNDIPFSCPAGRNVIAIPGSGPRGARLFLVVGDEHTVMYSVSLAASKPATSPRASAAHRSPQQETGGVGKKRKSSMSGRGVNTDSEERWCVQPVWRVRQGWGTVLATTVLESHENGGSVLLGDECGRLTALGWQFEGVDTVRVSKIEMGVASPPTALTYIDNSVIFISSACGDSLLATFNVSASKTSVSAIPRSVKGKGRAQDSTDGGAWTIVLDEESCGSVEVKERWMNIAPVKDFAVVEGEDGRASHIVVASGSSNTNSLRVVRSGVGLETVLTLDGIAGVQRMWPIAPPDSSNTLLVSTATSSAVLSLESDISLVKTAAGFSNASSLAAGLAGSGNALVQVTPASITVWEDIVAGSTLGSFAAPDDNGIVAAAVKGGNVVAAFRDGAVIVFSVAAAGLEETSRGQLSREVAAVDLHEFGSETAIATSDWNGDIGLYTPSGLAAGQPFAQINEPAFASSLLFQTSPDGRLRLLAGLSDGTLVTYDIDPTADCLTKSRNSSLLGSRPLQVAPLDLVSDLFEEPVTAVSISDRLTVLFESRKHLESSASGKTHVAAAASISIPTLGSCIAIATPDCVTIERLTSLRKIQVLTLDVGDASTIRLDFVPEQNILASGTITRTLDAETGDISQASGVDIRHPTTLELLASYQLPLREAVTMVKGVFLNGRSYIAVGTAIFSSDEAMDESSLDEISTFVPVEKGRLILLEATEGQDNWSLDEATTIDTTAAVYDAAVIHGFMAAASATKVSILRLQPQPPRLTPRLVEASFFSNAFEARYLATMSAAGKPDHLVIGDGMRSIVIVDIDEASGKINNTSRDMAAHSVRALGIVSETEQEVIISDNHSNLLTFHFDKSIEPGATFGLQEDVSRLRNGSLVPSSAPDIVKSNLLFATANGRLGIIGTLGKSATRTLQDLQRNLNKTARGPGNLEWKIFRRGGTSMVPKDTAGFVDGDFVQQFLDMDNAEVEAALHGSASHEAVHRIEGGKLEDASREHVVRVLEAAAGLH